MKTNENSISFFFSNINEKEKKVFERVVEFNKSHGLKADYSNDISSADIIIATETADLSQANGAIQLIITADQSKGDIQVAPPLLITRVMKAVENAIKMIGSKQGDSSQATPQSSPQATQNTIANSTTQAQYHALVIDDSASIRKQLELELRDAGITSDFAESGEQALEKIKDAQFDLVFLDIIMPGIDGYETCKAMRATAEYKKTPIIMLSGKSSPLDEVEGVIAGATCYLIKPVKSAMLQQTLTRVTKWIDNYADSKKKETESAI